MYWLFQLFIWVSPVFSLFPLLLTLALISVFGGLDSTPDQGVLTLLFLVSLYTVIAFIAAISSIVQIKKHPAFTAWAVSAIYGVPLVFALGFDAPGGGGLILAIPLLLLLIACAVSWRRFQEKLYIYKNNN